MIKKIFSSFILLLSASVCLLIIYYKIRTSIVQEVIAILLVIVLVLVNRLILARKKALPWILILFLVFLISSFVQLLIFSTGGFYSPFLILYHLFAIALGFLLGLEFAISFLVFSVTALLFSTFIDPRLYSIVSGDFGPMILYLLSFLVILPLFQVVVQRYNLKDSLSSLLTTKLRLTSTQLNLTKKREEMILSGLADLVVITDENLAILSLNKVLEQTLQLSPTQLLNHPLFDVLYLKDTNGQMINTGSLNPNKILKEAETYVFNDLLLYTKNSSFPKKVDMRVVPITYIEGKINQIAFIISGAGLNRDKRQFFHNIEQAIVRHDSLLGGLKNELKNRGLTNLMVKADLVSKAEKDILSVLEIDDQEAKTNLVLVDVAQLIERIIASKKEVASFLNIKIESSFDPGFAQKKTLIEVGTDQFSEVLLTAPYFSVSTDLAWLDILINKIFDLAILLNLEQKNRWVTLVMNYDAESVRLAFDIACPPSSQEYKTLLFSKYYGALGSLKGLSLGSGLEGYIIGRLSTLLAASLDLSYKTDTSSLVFNVNLSKKPSL